MTRLDAPAAWPALPPNPVEEAYTTLHLWTQIVGKIRMALAPAVNHWWHVPLYVSCRGLTTSPIPYRAGAFHIDFDFLRHELQFVTSTGAEEAFPLAGRSVASFYRATMASLRSLGIDVAIWPVPVELEDPILPFPKDETHAAYAPERVAAFWRALLQANRVFKVFRGRFIGKASPVHFFWGAFDLAVTRFSGRRAPQHPGGAPNVADYVMHEAYSHEVSSCGFWPGSSATGGPAFYAYAYPEPEGFKEHPVHPSAAYYHEELREFILPYEAVRRADDPDAALLAFLQSTYEAAAVPGNWDRGALEREAALA